MARIYLDARGIQPNPTGVGRYARCLIPELVRQRPQHDYVIIRHDAHPDPLPIVSEPDFQVTSVSVAPSIFEVTHVLGGRWTLGGIFDEHGPPDIYHSLFHLTPVGLKGAAGEAFRTVVTLHDLIWLDHPHQARPESWWDAEAIRLFGRLAIPHTLRSADHVICISEPTARRADPWLADDGWSTISHGVNQTFFQTPNSPDDCIDDWPAADQPHVIAIGNDKAYKNLGRVIEAFDDVQRRLAAQGGGEAKLVLVGSCQGLRPKIDQLGLGDDVWLSGFLDDEQLRAALGHARAFVFPSLVEGFGLPILEAMAMGVPTLVSDLEPMRTVGGDAAVPIDPHDPRAIADAMHDVLVDDDRHAELSARARKHAADYRWPTTAEKTWEVYDRLL